MTDRPDILQAALEYEAAGLSVIPVKNDGTKAPALTTWKQYTRTRATPEQIRTWFATGTHTGLGIVCGAVSGDFEMLEIEGRAIGSVPELAELADASGLGELWRTLTRSWCEQSPSGGIHFHYRVTEAVPGNTKLARDTDGKTTLAETRGEGGFVVVSPTDGGHHETGRGWIRLTGGPADIITLTPSEREALHALVRSLDRTPPPPEPVAGTWRSGPGTSREADAGTSPGDDFESRTDWADILHGWTLVHTGGDGTRYWRRPGKNRGVSATTGHAGDRDRLYVFTTSTELDHERPYTKFGAYAVLNHAGDFSAAARKLRSDGYGTEPTREVTTSSQGSDGNLATVHQLDTTQDRPQLTVVPRTLERSDDGNALALIDTYGEKIRYSHERGRWYVWDCSRWCEQPSGGGTVREYAKTLARALRADDRPALNHKRKSLSAIGVTNTLAQAQTDERIAIRHNAFDAHAYELNTPAGIVNLRTGTTTAPDPARLHTRTTACVPDADADPGRWNEFLADTFGDDTELIGYLQRLIGYSVVGYVGPHVLPFCYGSGGNGKGVFLEAIAKVLGDYATTAPSGFLMAKTYSAHETEKARLSGARMVICSEVNEHDRFDEARVKELTGGDTITARFMRQDHFTFTPTHQLWLMGNYQPAVESGGPSFWRRLRLIPFTHTVAEDKRVDDLQGILARDHGPAILSWVIAGAAAYVSVGLAEPESVRSATEAYQHDQDTVARFIEECCWIGGGAQAVEEVGKVRAAYEAWCHNDGSNPVTAKKLTMEMRRRGVITGGLSGKSRTRVYANLMLCSTDEQPVNLLTDPLARAAGERPER